MTALLRSAMGLLSGVRDAALYHSRYFGMIDEAAERSAAGMARFCHEAFRPRSVIDYGCGTGAFLAAMQRHGCFVAGTEFSPPARRLCDKKNVPTIPVNLVAPPPSPPLGYVDMATSFEVAEHLPASAADGFVRLLAASAAIVVFSAATPGQGGKGHINEQPHEYWVARFQAAGKHLAASLTEECRAAWKASGVEWWYVRNVMIFRDSALPLSP